MVAFLPLLRRIKSGSTYVRFAVAVKVILLQTMGRRQQDLPPFMETTRNAAAAHAAPSAHTTWQIIATVFFNFVIYLLIGLPLAVFPSIVHGQLGLSATLAGFLISLQYAATFVTRSTVGRIADSWGPKWTVLGGLACGALSGLCVLEASTHSSTTGILVWLCLSRLFLGAAESGASTGCITWGIGRVGAAHTAEVISWNGVASYGGIAAGAPIGVLLSHIHGLTAVGLATTILPLLALGLCVLKKPVPVVRGTPIPLSTVFRRMLPFGGALALGSLGFATIVAFIALYFSNHHWNGAAYALTAFGASFASVRIFFSRAIHKFGGYRCSLVSFVIEFLGLVIIWLAADPWVAICGAMLTGFGLSLIFPALAVEALKTVTVSNRGAAIAVYTVFLDVSLGATGPLAGIMIGHFGYPSVYLLGALAVACAQILTWRLAVLAKTRRLPVAIENSPAGGMPSTQAARAQL
jgi:MFS family permease